MNKIYDMDWIGIGFRISLIMMFLGVFSLFFSSNWIFNIMLLFGGLIAFTMFPAEKKVYFGINIVD